ncbi:unnamed protein product [Hymenolepis diminuta]|uniref:Uncharacterized protein n=1 Tax=Hymenolepis diminuta TaxID=6216 RepID=A0A564YQU2_HYMDI|nr:unnamed protein product [Hymenolepis diminuta]
MDIGALTDAHDPIPMILGLLNNGAMFAFKISPPPSGDHPQSLINGAFARFKLWCGSADKPPQLPSASAASPNMTIGESSKTRDGSVDNLSSPPGPKPEAPSIGFTPSNLGSPPSCSFSKSTNYGSPGLAVSAPSGQTAGFSFSKPVVNDNAFASTPNITAFGSMFSKPADLGSQASGTTLFGSTPVKANMNSSSGSILAGLLGKSGDADKSQAQKSDFNTVIPSAGMPSGFNFDKPTPSDPKLASNTVPPSTVAFGNSGPGKPINSDKPNSSSPKSEPTKQADIQAPAAVTKPEPKEPPQMAQSIIAASNQFSKALKSQAEASARAWSHLHNTFDGHFTNFQQTPGENGVGRSVWDIEQSLDNMENFLRVIDEITSQLQKASQISVSEQKSSADYLDRLNADFDVFSRRMNDRHRAVLTAGLDPEAANMLSTLKRKSRGAESCLAELEEQIESLAAKLEAKNERSNRISARSRLSLQLSDVGSTLGKIQATVATNARLIKHERSRLELISRMAGISLSDSLSTKPKNISHLSLGGSAIPLDREQRDAMFYRLLCSGDVKSKGKESKRKINPTADQRIPVVKAPSAVTDVLASMRMLEEAKNKTPIQSTPKLSSMNKSVDKSASALTPSVTTNKLPTPPSKQLSSLGKQKNQEISKLLASAESVPPVTLASGSPSPRAPLLNFSTSANDSTLLSTPLPKTAEKPQPKSASEPGLESPTPITSSVCTSLPSTTPQMATSSSGTSPSTRSSVFVPSASMTLTSPTRATTISAPTTKVFGAPKGSTGVDNFKPLSPRLHSLQSVDESTPPTTIQSPATPQNIQSTSVKPPSGNVFDTMTTSSSPVSSPIPASSTFGVTTTTSTSEAPKISFGTPSTAATSEPPKSIFGPPSTTPSTEPSKLSFTSPTPTSATEPRKNLFDVSIIPSSASGPAKNLFGTSATASPSEPAKSLFGKFDGAQSSSTTSESTKSLFGTPVTTTSTTTQQVQTFGTTITAATTTVTSSTASTSSKPTSLFDAATSTVPATSQPAPLFGSLLSSTTAPFSQTSGTTVTTTATSQPTSLFGVPASKPTIISTASSPSPGFGSTVAATTTPTSIQPSQTFDRPQTTSQSPQSSELFGQSANLASGNLFGKTAAPTSGLFGQAPIATASSPPSGLFGQPAAATTPSTASSGGLFGQAAPVPAGGFFGQTATATTIAAPSGNLFGQTSSTSGGLFGQPSTNQQTGSLFSQPAQIGGLFGLTAATTQASGGLFGQPSQTPASPSGGLFAGSSNAGGLFGQSPVQPSTGGLFGQSSASSGGTTGGGLFGQVQPPQAPQSGGLFASASNTGPSGGLFSTPKLSDGGLFGSNSTASSTASSTGFHSVSNVSNLFAMSNFGLGSTPTTNSGSSSSIFGKPVTPSTGQTQNLFGSSPANANTSSTTNKSGGLFGTPTLGTVSTGDGGGGLFGSSSATTNPPSGGVLFGGSPSTGGCLFGSSTGSTGGPLFGAPPTFGASNNQTSNSTPNSGGGSLFSSNTGGGLFGSSGNTSTGGSLFGAAPSFGGPAVFGASATFGAGSKSPTGPVTTTAGAGGLFASLGNTAGGPTFGGLANAPQSPAPLFGSSPSFMQRRA